MEAARKLWSSGDAGAWQSAHAKYGKTLKSAKGEKTSKLDGWKSAQLSKSLREKKSLSKNDYTKLIEWKLSRGKFRPALMGMAKAMDESALEAAVKESFLLCESSKLKQSMDALCRLRGVGPATGSAILSCFDPAQFVFMGDELLETLSPQLGSRKYTSGHYWKLHGLVSEKVAELENEDPDFAWSMSFIEECIFAVFHDVDDQSPTTASKKRKRSVS